VPHLSDQALEFLLMRLIPLLPKPPRRGPRGMPLVDRVRIAFSYAREGVTWRGLARILGQAPSTLWDNVRPVYKALASLTPVLPDGSPLETFGQVISWCQNHGLTMVIDGTELPCQRPEDADEQALCYSGKKKRHTLKTIVFTDCLGRIIWLTPLAPGAMHDFAALLDSGAVDELKSADLEYWVDSGFQGLGSRLAHVVLPEKRRKGEKLSRASKFFNRLLARERVVVEHANARLKSWRCIAPHQVLHRNVDENLYVAWLLTSYQQAWPRTAPD